MNRLKAHPLANIFPMLDGLAISILAADIRQYGLREPVLLHQGMILDGRNRYAALCELQMLKSPLGPGWSTLENKPLPADRLDVGLHGLYVDWQGARLGHDALALVLSLNLHRRHLDESQRAMIAARLTIAAPAKGRKSAVTRPPIGGLTTLEAAGRLNVGQRTLERARAVLLSGSKPLIDAIDKGRLAVAEAQKALALDPATQQQVAELADAGQVRSVRHVVKQGRREVIEADLGRRQDKLPEGRFGVILADPPWRFEMRSQHGMDRSVENHYPTLPTDDICALPVEAIAADHAILLLWSTAAMLPDGLDVMDDWGFAYRSHMVWDKGELSGLGYWLRNRHELLLIGTRGRPPAPAEGTQWPSLIQASRAGHSTKPGFAHAFAETFWPSLAKVELFARSPRLGWSVWGNQAVAA
jgi:N6-adenosine-specific RNA methylase IME4